MNSDSGAKEYERMTLRKGSTVWVEDKDSAWVAAEVTDFIGKQLQLLTVSGKKVIFFFEFFSFFGELAKK